MSLLRLNDFVSGTVIQSGLVDDEFTQLVEALNGVDSMDILHKYDHATTPVLNLNQLNTDITSLLLKGQRNSVDTFKIKSNGYIVGYPKCIFENHVDVGNVGAGLDPLRSFSLPANTLATDGDWVKIIGAGNYANTEADKQVRHTFDSQLIISFGATIDLENGSWFSEYYVIRQSATQVRFYGIDFHVQGFIQNGALVVAPSGWFHVPRSLAAAAVANLNNNAVTILFEGEGSANNDVVQNHMQVWACQMT